MTGVLSLIAGERQDAVSADMRRYYGTSLRDAMHEWTARDLTSAVRNLPRDSATVRTELGDLYDWNHMSANIAELVDLMHYWLHSEYAKWIYDPDDPENRAAKRSKVKPPKEPLIPPVAFRPNSVAQQRVAEYAERVAELAGDDRAERSISSDEFDALIDL